MKKTLAAAAVALAGAAGAANAADLYSGGLKDTAFVPPPLWTGLYIGANVGGAWADLKTTDRDGIWSGTPGTGWTDSASGIIGGGQIGYNWQANNVFNGFVFGVEADFGGTGFSVNHHPFDVGYNDGVDSGFYADFTGRLGYAAGPALFYIKGGWAYFDGNNKLSDTVSLGGPYSLTTNGLSGWTFGGGIEYKFAPNWSAKVEYQYFDFGNFNQNLYGTGFTGFDRNLTANAVKVGINYFVGSVYTPLK